MILETQGAVWRDEGKWRRRGREGKGLREMKRSAVIKGLQHLEGDYGTV